VNNKAEQKNTKISPSVSLNLDEIKYSKRELWDRPSFSRVLGGFWYNYVLAIGLLAYAIIFMALLFPNYILPFPEAMGFKNLVQLPY